MRELPVRDALARLPAEYVFLNKDGSRATGDPEPLGSGGTSVVYRALYRSRLQRAVKFMVPREDLKKDLGIKLFANSFENEIAALTELSHENVARLTDLGTTVGTQIPYVVTEYVDGTPLDEFCSGEQTRGRDVIAILRKVLQGLAYMHERDIMHCDIKPANILVPAAENGRRGAGRAVIVDLGGSHRISEYAEDAGKFRYTYFFSTPHYALPRLRPSIGNHNGNRILTTELAAAFPWQDLYSFGAILRDLLRDGHQRELLCEELGPRNLEALEEIGGRLDDPGANRSRYPAPGYQTARDVLHALDRVSFASMAPMGIPELAPVPEKGVTLPTSRTRVAGSHRINSIIEHPLFQRLHNLPQLDLLHYVLPGATHTRFVHALHVYDLARLAVCYQLPNWEFRMNVEAADIEQTLFAALLDSVGRYHLQHMFEDFTVARRQADIAQAGLLTSHELLDTMMGARTGELADAFAGIRDNVGRTLDQVVEPWLGVPWSEIREKQRDATTPVRGFLAGLMSSPVDVDKLAYLIDDSAFSGLPFGQAVSAPTIFEAMRVPHYSDWKKQPHGIAVALREKALSYVEQAMLSRYWNIQAGYWYRTNRSLQTMVKYQIGALLRSRRLTFSDFVLNTLHLSADGALRWLDGQFNNAIRDGSIDGETVNPLAGLLESRRDVYKRLVTISPQSQVPSRERDRFVFEGLKSPPALDDHIICSRVSAVLESIKPGLHIRPGEILLDLPRVRREETGGNLLVYADRPGAELIGEVSSISPVLNKLKDQFDLYAKRLRVFLHPRVDRELEGLQERAHRAVLEMLRREYDGNTV